MCTLFRYIFFYFFQGITCKREFYSYKLSNLNALMIIAGALLISYIYIYILLLFNLDICPHIIYLLTCFLMSFSEPQYCSSCNPKPKFDGPLEGK